MLRHDKSMPPCRNIPRILHRISWVEHYWNYIAIYCIEGLLQMGEGEQQQKDTEQRYPHQIAERISGDGRTTIMQDTDTLIFTSKLLLLPPLVIAMYLCVISARDKQCSYFSNCKIDTYISRVKK